MKRIIEQSLYKELVEAIGRALSEGRNKAIQTVNATLVKTNWQRPEFSSLCVLYPNIYSRQPILNS